MPAAKYDIESFSNEILSILQSNLNTKIAELNTEKNDGLTLATVASGAYFFQGMDGKQANFDPFVLYGVDDLEEQEDQYGRTKLGVKFQVLICVEDRGQDVQIGFRMWRYGRALKEIFEENFELAESGIKLSISSLVPVPARLFNSSQKYRVVGVTLQAEFG